MFLLEVVHVFLSVSVHLSTRLAFRPCRCLSSKDSRALLASNLWPTHSVGVWPINPYWHITADLKISCQLLIKLVNCFDPLFYLTLYAIIFCQFSRYIEYHPGLMPLWFLDKGCDMDADPLQDCVAGFFSSLFPSMAELEILWEKIPS